MATPVVTPRINRAANLIAARLIAARLIGVVVAIAAGQGSARATEIPPPAYQIAARQAGVPSPVLFAIALQESGTRLRGRLARLTPWPWTLNVAGRGKHYATRAEACDGIRHALARHPARRIDVGLGQINLGYHTRHYVMPCDLLDPYANLTVAARILRAHYRPGEDWSLAIGRYHRPAGGEPAARYRRSVGRHLARIEADHRTQPADDGGLR